MTIPLNKYRVRCRTEDAWVEGWFDDIPTVCPNDIAHTIIPDRSVLLTTAKSSADTLRISRFLPKVPGATHGELESPLCLDYKAGLTTRMHKVVDVMFRGEVRQVSYYDMASVDADPDNPASWDLVLKVEIEYIRDAMDLASSRTVTRTWYHEDGTPFLPAKVTTKKYSNFYAMKEGNRRRQNVVEDSSLTILGLLMYTQTGGDPFAAELLGREFTAHFEAELTQFVRVGDVSFKEGVEADTTFAWLDNDLTAIGYPPGTTIRDVIVAEVVDISDPPEPWQ